MEKLINDIKKTNEVLTEKTKIFREFEDSMRSEKVYVPFKLEVEPCKYLSWEQDPASKEKAFRLFVADHNTSIPKEPIRQTKFAIRAYYVKYMEHFIKEFNNNLNKLLENHER